MPTLRGWLALLGVMGTVILLFLGLAYPFLSMNQPLPGGVLVIEGWSPDFMFLAAKTEFKRNPYRKLFVTGGALERGAPLSEYKTYADLGAAILVKLGMDTNSVQATPSPYVRKDRTYASALALKKWMRDHNMQETKFNLITAGAHARRSRLLFEKAMGGQAEVGVIAMESTDFEPGRWFTSSQGVRVMLSEMIGYVYVKLFFWRGDESI